jgi:uncharacterized protein
MPSGMTASRSERDDMTTVAPLATPDNQLAKLLEAVVAALRPEAIYLFGSRSRGTARIDSDYDLLVIVPDDVPTEKLRLDETYRLARAAKVPADIIACRRNMFDRNRERIGTLSYKVSREGALVYGQ